MSDVKWKKLKDIFSLWKTVFEIIISVYLVIIKTIKERQLMGELSRFQRQVIKSNRSCYVIMRKIIVLRRKKRFHEIEVFIYLMRFIMLTKALKLAGHQYLHPIFVSICGLL